LFDTADTIRTAVRLCAAVLRNTRINRAACAAAASDPALLATDLADYLVRKGLPFRKAHHAVGALVALAEREGKRLDQLSLAELQSVEKRFASDAVRTFDLKRALARRRLPGSPGTAEVRKQLAAWHQRLRRP
jgi:argininosuccinate lyase